MVQIAPAVAALPSLPQQRRQPQAFPMRSSAAAKYQEDVARQNAAFQAKLTASNVARAKLAANPGGGRGRPRPSTQDVCSQDGDRGRRRRIRRESV